MSAPVTERTKAATRARTATIPAQRPAPAAGRGRDAGAAGKAYARREDRLRKLVGARSTRTATPGRAKFVLLVMALLAVGIVATLWLSTAAAADSYKLQAARTEARDLQEQSERLRREVAGMAAPTALAQRAAELGMVPVPDPPRVVVAPDGSVTIAGEPRVATKPAPPAPKPVVPPAAPPAATPPAATPPAGTATNPAAPPADAAAAATPGASTDGPAAGAGTTPPAGNGA